MTPGSEDKKAPGHRQILHVDMDAFYASVEQRDRPELRGKPVVVGGDVRGVVAAASYEARKFGIRSAMPMREAERRCPNLVRIPVRMSWYKSVSDEVFAIFRGITPLVEGLSLDEAFLDVTGSLSLFGSAEDIAALIKARILSQCGLTASVGVAPNKLVAKIASDLDKPDGLVIVTEDNLHSILDPLPVEVIPGIGPNTRMRLNSAGIRTIAELRCAPDRILEPLFGRYTRRTRERASGLDDRPVQPSRKEKSISAEETYPRDLADRREMLRELMRLCERTAARLRAKSLVAGTVQLKIRQGDFTTFTRQQALRPPGNDTNTLFGIARRLLDGWLSDSPGSRVRLLGVGGSELAPAVQGDLFAPDENHHPLKGDATPQLDRAVDEIRGRFGDRSLNRARGLDPRQPR
ncbi:MAG TPA: DNA polymerase IV [Woeseiaceae bacterium]|nr:DNA polymerase IV [Woeseiaceae bacterium]